MLGGRLSRTACWSAFATAVHMLLTYTEQPTMALVSRHSSRRDLQQPCLTARPSKSSSPSNTCRTRRARGGEHQARRENPNPSSSKSPTTSTKAAAHRRAQSHHLYIAQTAVQHITAKLNKEPAGHLAYDLQNKQCVTAQTFYFAQRIENEETMTRWVRSGPNA